MPVKLGKKKYEKFSDASAAVQKKKGISKNRANAYVASVERKQGISQVSYDVPLFTNFI